MVALTEPSSYSRNRASALFFLIRKTTFKGSSFLYYSNTFFTFLFFNPIILCLYSLIDFLKDIIWDSYNFLNSSLSFSDKSSSFIWLLLIKYCKSSSVLLGLLINFKSFKELSLFILFEVPLFSSGTIYLLVSTCLLSFIKNFFITNKKYFCN